MEDSSSSQGGTSTPGAMMRRHPSHNLHNERPGSSASNHTRLTLSSSGASVVSSPHSQAAIGTPRASSTRGPSLLQERLRERKVESARNASAGGDMSAMQSSPIRASMREERRPSSSKAMGVKQIEEQVSTLHKQNFDLKLELYHRRQRQEALEAQLEAAEKRLEEQAEMQEVNEQLLAELERRDQALDEAVGVIVTLEDKVGKMEREREMVRSVDESPYIPGEDFSSSPPQMDDSTPRRRVVRMPSFLSEQSEGTEALRSLYLPLNHSFSDAALPKLEEESFDGMNSPRLSVLSESSFLSVYGDKKFDLDAESEEPKRHRVSSSVEKWIEERPAPSKTPRGTSPDLLRRKQFVSINDVLESPLQRLEKLRHTLEKHALPERSNGVAREKQRGQARTLFPGEKSFEAHPSLPPTPDTFSTNTLHHHKGSDDTLALDGTFLGAKSTLNPGLNYNRYQSTLSMRPRSAGETVTSRREGHGWDTSTQDDFTETGSTSSTYSPSASNERQRVRTPELFNFGSSGQERDWGRNVMFNHNEVESEVGLPVSKHHNNVRRSSMVEAQHPRSHNTAVQNITRYPDLQNGTGKPIEPPDRRSSLSAVAKLSKPGGVAQQGPASSPAKETLQAQITAPMPPVSRKSRLASRLFGVGRAGLGSDQAQPQSESIQAKAPNPPPHSNASTPQRQQAPPRPTYNAISRSQSNQYYIDGLSSNSPSAASREDDRATPPPIRRSKTTGVNPRMAARGRPSSAGGVKQVNGFGGDGAFEDNVAGGDKHFGHRRGSLSVDLGVARGLSAILGGGVEDETVGAENLNGEGKKKWFGGLRRG